MSQESKPIEDKLFCMGPSFQSLPIPLLVFRIGDPWPRSLRSDPCRWSREVRSHANSDPVRQRRRRAAGYAEGLLWVHFSCATSKQIQTGRTPNRQQEGGFWWYPLLKWAIFWVEFGVSARGEADEVVSGLAEFHGSRMPPRQRGKLPAKCGNRSSFGPTISSGV
jgi:hypothetical protein